MSESRDQINTEQNAAENVVAPHSEDVNHCGNHSIDEFTCSACLKNDKKLEESTCTPPLNNKDTGYSILTDDQKLEESTGAAPLNKKDTDYSSLINQSFIGACLKNDKKLEESTGTPPLNNKETGYSILKNDKKLEESTDTTSLNNKDTDYSSFINQSFIGSLDSMQSFCANTAHKFNEEHVDICSYITTKSPRNLEGLAPCLKGKTEKKRAIISDVSATKEYMELLLKLERPLRPYQLEQKASQLEKSRESESFHTRVAIESLRYIAFQSGGGGPNTVKAVMENYINR
eukprot:CAMPEP_0194298422 /NCGR_PEP_ID=MMETSP0169-20130528/60155_1 /TAXON_ID=218684 /ORGANISM="Corethron pennatum, Strain L29A3" /LENGTH=288 /DNA_ID=CAMNT_0039048399 /DNA_START=314 /DNA_END=1180 /DNA_ORIENTATION=-